jgi:exopolysaccharide biosynthesis protein
MWSRACGRSKRTTRRFPEGAILLVGRGTAAAWLADALPAGAAVETNLTTAPDWRAARAVVGGGPLLVANGRVVDDPYSPAPAERDQRNPVAAVGITEDGRRLLIIEVDGRQPRLSIGLTQPELASYLRWLGAYQAMAFDSGGSATLVARLPGRSGPCVLNSPSDGRERPVANALLVYSAGRP